MVREVEDVPHGGGAKAVDGLGVVADHGQPSAVRLELQKDLGLERVGVLILVNQDEVEPSGDVLRDCSAPHHLCPIEQQIVVIEDTLCLLGQGVGTKQRFQLPCPVAAPGKRLRQQPLDLHPGVDRVRVDRKTGRLLRKAAVLLAQPPLVPYQIHQIGGVTPIEHREIGVEADRLGV